MTQGQEQAGRHGSETRTGDPGESQRGVLSGQD